eukprot:g858.t1
MTNTLHLDCSFLSSRKTHLSLVFQALLSELDQHLTKVIEGTITPIAISEKLNQVQVGVTTLERSQQQLFSSADVCTSFHPSLQ